MIMMIMGRANYICATAITFLTVDAAFSFAAKSTFSFLSPQLFPQVEQSCVHASAISRIPFGGRLYHFRNGGLSEQLVSDSPLGDDQVPCGAELAPEAAEMCREKSIRAIRVSDDFCNFVTGKEAPPV